jgi:hypothetical protein
MQFSSWSCVEPSSVSSSVICAGCWQLPGVFSSCWCRPVRCCGAGIGSTSISSQHGGVVLLPPIFWIVYTLLGLAMVWLNLKLPGNPAVIWCVLGGVAGFLSYIYAIYGLRAVLKPPIMQGTDPLVVLIFSFFEIAFYWSLILLACRIIWRVYKRELG